MSLPTKVQLGNFGDRAAAPAGGTLVTGRPAQPRPALVQRGAAQGHERFVAEGGRLNPDAVARALNRAQKNIDEATGPARANPMLNGHLFQNVPLNGPLSFGTSSPPNTAGLPIGFQYWDVALGKPLFYNGTNWIDAAGALAYSGTVGTAAYTTIEHGVGSPAVGFLITNVTNATLTTTPRLVPAGDATDKTMARIWTPYMFLTGGAGAATPAADIYVFF